IGKHGAKGDIGFFIGYSTNSCAYRVYHRMTKKIMETMNVTFDELSAMAFEQISSKPGLQSMTFGQISLGLDLTYASSTITTQQPTEAPQVLQTPTATTTTTNTAPSPINSSSQATNFPNTSQDVDELETQQQHVHHQPASIADNVLNAMFDENTFRTRDHPLEQVIGEPSRPVLIRNQLRSDGDMCMYALTVSTMEPKNVQEAMTDHAWIESIMEAIRIFLAYVAQKSFTVFEMDVKTAFLHVKEGTLWVKASTKGMMILSLVLQSLVNQSPCGIFMNQSNYVLEILRKYGMETGDTIGTPMEIKDKLDLDQNGTLVDATIYSSMIGALMYLTSSRLDIVHATCLCAQHQAKPTEKNLKEVKKIFRYLWRTINIGLWYTNDSGFKLTGFSDVDYARCKDSFKSTSGGTQFLGKKLVSWSSKKQDCTALSTLETEYVSLSTYCAQVIWMRTQLTDYGFHFNKIPIYCDSKSAIAISCNLVQLSRTKHIAVRYHFIKEHMEKGMIELYFVKTDYQLADLFTKALPVDRFNYLVHRLGMRSLSPHELERLAKSR
ncbi:hypothetical protein Tco_1296149, partial [Tanacetum coccineum]